MTELIYFLGRFHVLVLHIPIGLIVLALVMEVLTRRPRFAQLAPALNFVWLAAALSSAAAVTLGYMHATEPGFDSEAVDAHRYAGSFLMLITFLVWGMRVLETPLYVSAWPVFCVAVAGVLALTGHYGGNLTHGETYLVAYAPAPLRVAMGMPVARGQPADVASADIFLDVVGPALERRCVSCHNEGRRRGGLSLESHAALMAGGEAGPAVRPGAAADSELVRRISLASDHEDFMPADGKTPLTDAETAAVRWWVDAGAPASATIASLAPPPEALEAIAVVLGLAAGEIDGAGAGESLPEVAPADAEAVAALRVAGFSVRPVAQDSNLLDVDFAAGRDLTDEDMALLGAIAPQVLRLNLRDAGVTDARLAGLSGFVNLDRLRLELNPVTAAGIAQLAPLDRLSVLNLHGTDVGDAVFETAAGLDGLEQLYLWNSAVTDDAVAQFRSARPDVVVDDGFDRSLLPESPDFIPVVN